MRAAAYARVSTERQERQQTIDSQLTALSAWAREAGHELKAAHVFRTRVTAAHGSTGPGSTRCATPSAMPRSTSSRCSALIGWPVDTPIRC